MSSKINTFLKSLKVGLIYIKIEDRIRFVINLLQLSKIYQNSSTIGT